MKKSRLFTAGALALTLALGLVLTGCDTGDNGGNNGGSNPFNGTLWSGVDSDGDSVTLSFTGSAWTLTYLAYGSTENGSYTYSGNVATFQFQGITGTATISGNNLIVIVNGSVMTLTRGSGNNNPGGGTTVPSAPTGVSATAQSSSSIRVTWNSVSGATSYDVYYEIGSSTTKNFAGNATSTSYTHTGLTASTTYYYYIKAKNSAGESGYSSYDYATTQSSGGGGSAPGTPTGVNASATSSSSITVSWSTSSNATGYRIYRSSSSTGTYCEVGTSTTTSYTNTGLSANTTYYYKVAAYNSIGSSSQSSAVSATTQSSGSGGGSVLKTPDDFLAYSSSSSSSVVAAVQYQTSDKSTVDNYAYVLYINGQGVFAYTNAPNNQSDSYGTMATTGNAGGYYTIFISDTLSYQTPGTYRIKVRIYSQKIYTGTTPYVETVERSVTVY